MTDTVYEVQNVKVDNTENGRCSSLILSGGGKRFHMFLNGSDARLVPGAKITNVKAEPCSNSFGKYVLLNSYDVAA